MREGKDRIGQKSPRKRTDQSTEQGDRQKRAGVCGLRFRVGQLERMSQDSLWVCGSFARIHARDSP